MIILDFNQVAMISVHASQSISSYTDEDQIRHIMLNVIRTINSKFSTEYGKIIVACDSRKSWRKVVFPYYKAHRKADRAKSDVDWKTAFHLIGSVKDELREYTSWPVIEVVGAEGDDIIGALILHLSHEKNLIVSADGDFKQLQAWADVDQYDPIHKRFVHVDNPVEYLREHIFRGDRGDGVPNILSDDDTFINEGKRQGKVTDKRMQEWFLSTLDGNWPNERLKRNYDRNKRLIDLRETPEKLREKIIAEYEQQSAANNKHRIYEYLINHKLTNLLDCVNDFA